MAFKVKAGVALPARNPLSMGRRPTYPFADMAIDQLIFVPGKTTREMSTYVASRGRLLGRKFSTQSTWMRQDLKTDEWEPCSAHAPGARQGVAITRIA